ncbi:MAG: phage tail assembly protein [Synergistaceae bacterium]|nr:phage tail assembly protein [Synergistaceae bacterium]
MKIKLKKAISFHGEEIKELELNLDDLTGNDLIQAEKQAMTDESLPMVTDFTRAYQITIAAQALKMPVEILRTLPAKDFSRIANEVQRFLLNSASSETDEAEIRATAPETSLEE